MRHLIFLLTTFISSLLTSPIIAQITLDHTYPNGKQKLFMVELESSGIKFVELSEEENNRYLKFYNLNHSLWKTIDCNPLTTTTWCGSGSVQYKFDALYISENLFDCDDDIEFLYTSMSDCAWFTAIYKEDGTELLVADNCAPLVKINVPQQYRPIYNTPDGTKLILSNRNGTAVVYDIPCELVSGIDRSQDNSRIDNFNVYPNPTTGYTTVEYQIPNHIGQAEIVLTNINGQAVRKYIVDHSFSSLILSNEDLSTGTYFCTMIADQEILNTRKIIVN